MDVLVSQVEAPAKKRKRTEGREGAGAEAEQASGVADEGGKSKKKKKRKGGEERAEGEGKENGAPHENGEEAQGGVFKWEKEIKRLVKKVRPLGRKHYVTTLPKCCRIRDIGYMLFRTVVVMRVV